MNRGQSLLNGSNIEQTRSYNRRVVLEAVRMWGPLSRADIARLTCLAPQTVSNIAKELQGAGLLQDQGRRRAGRGQPPKELAINPAGGYTVGLQLDHRRLLGVLVNLTGEVLAEADLAMASATPSVAVPAMADMVNRLIAGRRVARRRVLGIGAVMPGPFEVERLTSVGPTTLPEWAGFQLADALTQRLGLPAFVENDATAAAVGESFYGAARELQHFVYIFIGMGLGAGMVVDGQPYRGAWGNAGEIGHMVIEPDGLPCTCGNYGCLEQYVSVHSAIRDLQSAGLAVETPEDIAQLTHEANPALRKWVERAAAKLRIALCSLENLLDPEAVLIGGHLPDRLMTPLLAGLADLRPSVSSRSDRRYPRIIRAAVGPQVTALGAAVLPIYESMSLQLRVLLKSDNRDSAGVDRRARLRPRTEAGAAVTGPQ